MEKIDEVISEQLDIIPAQITIIEHVRYKYSCKHCNEVPKTAPMPPQPIPKSRASDGFLAYIATNKYADGLPLYCQCHALKHLGIEQDRHTLAHQKLKAGELIQSLIKLYHDKALEYPVLQMDKTRTQVRQNPPRPLPANPICGSCEVTRLANRWCVLRMTPVDGKRCLNDYCRVTKAICKPMGTVATTGSQKMKLSRV